MPPVRRYLRISAYSVLEVRIYLDNPADAHRWLLHSSDPALQRIIQAVRPFVLPKLREENERSKKGSKKKSVKDVVTGEDFEVSIFLMDLSTPHSLLTRAKVFGEAGKGGAGSSAARPLEVAGEDGNDDVNDGRIPGLRQEDSDDDGQMDMSNIPMATSGNDKDSAPVAVSDSDGEPTSQTRRATRANRSKKTSAVEEQDDKKKLGFRTSYEGFRIHGKILCLVVKRKTSKKTQTVDNTGQAMLENWIASTQENTGMLDE